MPWNAMTAKQASDAIQWLEVFAAKPSLLLGKPDILLAQVFLSGFQVALWKVVGVDPGLHEQVVSDRGWRPMRAAGPGIEAQMLERGWSAEQVIAEFVAIEIEMIRRSIR